MKIYYLQHQGGRIAFDDAGEGPLVVCAPSMGDLRLEYRYLIPQLTAAGYRAASMDLRGHGETSIQWPDYSVGAIGSDLLALLQYLDAGPAVLVGTSMSAGAAVWAAAESPLQVRGLVLIGPFVRGETSPASRLLYTLLFARPWGPAAWLRYFASLFPTRKPADFPQYAAALRENLQEQGRLEALKQMLVASKAASEQRLPRVNAPTLVLMGSKDPDFKDPQAEARWVAESLHGTYQIIEGAGHYPHVEMPEDTGARVLAFLQTVPKWPA